MSWRSRSRQSWITSLMNCSSVFPNRHRLHLSHLYNNNHISNAAFQIKWDEHSAFQLRLVKIRVPLHLLLMLQWLLLLLMSRMFTRAITRMMLIKISTMCNHQHHLQLVDLRYIFATVGLPHHLRYEIMSIFLN